LFKITDIDTLKNLVISVCYDKHVQPFYARRANTGKITILGDTSIWCRRSRGTPHLAPRNFVIKTTVFAAAHGKNLVILACTVLAGLQSVTNRQADGQTPKRY